MPQTIPEPKRGDSIKDWAIQVTREVARFAKLLVADGSSGLEVVGGTLRVRSAARATTSVLTPSGGIPAQSGTTPGSAVCTFYEWDGTNETLGTRTETVRNRMSTAVSGNSKTQVYWERGSWWATVQGGSAGLVPVRLPASAIAGRVALGGTYSSGTATYYTDSGTALTVGSTTVTVYNPYTTATPASKLAWCASWNGKLWVVVVEC